MNQNGKTTDGQSKLISGYHKDELIEADGTHFEDAILDNCMILYSGGDVTWNNLVTKDCTFRFLGCAIKTINFLKEFKATRKAEVIDLADLKAINEHKH